MSLQITTSSKGSDVYVALNGYLDENCALPEFNEQIHGKMVINLEGVMMINSLGSRRWLNWVKAVNAKGGVVLTRCSAPFITQVNVLHNFLPPEVLVESFQVPYLCPKCTHEDQMLFQVGTSPDVPETRTCTSCGAQADLDIVKSKYFNFLNKGTKKKAG